MTLENKKFLLLEISEKLFCSIKQAADADHMTIREWIYQTLDDEIEHLEDLKNQIFRFRASDE